jgi:hypothetical protein
MQSDNLNIVEPEEILEQGGIGSITFERDLGKHQQIWVLPLNKQEEA